MPRTKAQEIERALFPERKNPNVAISNPLIQARERTSLLQSKIELLAIARMNDSLMTKEKVDAKGNPYSVHYVVLTTGEIKYLTGTKGGGLYQQVFAAVTEMKTKLHIYMDEETQSFRMDNLYGECSYKGGKLSIEFNPNTEHLFLELKRNFSKIPLGIALGFHGNGGFQMYKLIKTYAFRLPPIDASLTQEELPDIVIEMPLTELRMELGYVDIKQKEIRAEALKNNPNYDKIDEIEKSTRPKFRRWYDFNKNVLLPGIKEINETSDLYISGIDTKKAAHGKIEGVTIHVQHNRSFYDSMSKENSPRKTEPVEKTILNDDELDDFLDEIRELIDEKIKIKDCKAIAKAADYDMKKIKTAYQVAKTSRSDIDNIVGFMISAIKDEYTTIPKEDNSDLGKYRAANKEKLDAIYNDYVKLYRN